MFPQGPFPKDDLVFAALVAYLTIVYVAYIASGALPSDKQPARRPASRVIADRLAFLVLIAAVPILAFLALGLELPGLQALGLGRPSSWLIPTAGLAAAAWAMGRFSKKSKGDLGNYPQFLPARWGLGELAIEILSWAAYLFAYEFAFRGMLLHALLPLGTLGAIMVQTALYSFAHLPKSSKEAAGAILFGIVTSWLTLSYGSIMPAVLVHLAIALGNDRGSIVAGRQAA